MRLSSRRLSSAVEAFISKSIEALIAAHDLRRAAGKATAPQANSQFALAEVSTGLLSRWSLGRRSERYEGTR